MRMNIKYDLFFVVDSNDSQKYKSCAQTQQVIVMSLFMVERRSSYQRFHMNCNHLCRKGYLLLLIINSLCLMISFSLFCAHAQCLVYTFLYGTSALWCTHRIEHLQLMPINPSLRDHPSMFRSVNVNISQWIQQGNTPLECGCIVKAKSAVLNLNSQRDSWGTLRVHGWTPRCAQVKEKKKI